MPFQRRDNAFGRGFVGGHVGSQSDLSQRADWLWSARDLACHGERDKEGGFQIKASGKAEEAPQTFTRHQNKIVTSPFRKPVQPRLYRYCVGRIADGDHWTGDSVGTALFQHAEQLAKFARFRHHNSSPAQLFRHAQSFFAALLAGPSWRPFIAIARLQLTVAINALPALIASARVRR